MKQFVFTPEGTSGCYVKAWVHTSDESPELFQRELPAVVICPGGGYVMVSEREAEPVAERYFAAGYNTFILYYSVGEQAKNFMPLIQLAATVAEIRKNAKVWETDPEKIAVCGFSAGGHLACSLGTLYNNDKFLQAFGKDDNIRPNAMILCYPVITSDQYAHVGSIEGVSGTGQGTPEYEWFGLDRHVDADTPPAFLWHTSDDTCVPVENSLRMAAALSASDVPFELHIFPKGGHGMSVCTRQVNTECSYNAKWVGLSIAWLGQLFEYTL